MESDDQLFKGVFGESDINPLVFGLGKFVPPVRPAPLPTQPGVIPSARPAGSTPDKRKQEIRQLLEQSLAQVSWNEEVMSGLVAAVSSYVENQIG
jgi:hypothetical protein